MANHWIVIYQRTPTSAPQQETTTNVPMTVAILEAQGFIIIDIIDVG
jgi:hypothetical protein